MAFSPFPAESITANQSPLADAPGYDPDGKGEGPDDVEEVPRPDSRIRCHFFFFLVGFLALDVADPLPAASRFCAADLAPKAASQFAENFLLGAERTIGPDMIPGSCKLNEAMHANFRNGPVTHKTGTRSALGRVRHPGQNGATLL
jgi:hypothetical protein